MPQPGPQTEAIRKHNIDELFFGGAVAGGKSDYLLGDFAQDVPNYGSAWRGILFRKTYPELEELIQRSQEIYPPWFPGVEYKQSDKTWYWPTGATLKLRYIENQNDWARYWGHQYTWIGWDELPLWPNLTAYHKLKARLRSAHNIPNKRIRSTGNPGGPGHHAVMNYFGIDRYPLGGEVLRDERGVSRMFIRSKVTDNKILLGNDPGYIDRLKGMGSEALVRAWLDGDWSIIAGAFFDNWSPEKHVIRPFTIPDHWLRFRSFDWGSARPFSVGWWAVVSENYIHDGKLLPQGALVRYREWYGMKEGEPNVGLKMPVEDVARGIVARTREPIAYSVADPAIFAEDGGPSFAERMAKAVPTKDKKGYNLIFKPADNKRVAGQGHIGGWDQVRGRLDGMDGNPMLFTFDTCHHFIRTLPALQHDENRPEDVDTNSEDHAPDEARYACMSRPWIKPKPEGKQEIDTSLPTMDELWEEHDRQYGY